MHEPGPGERHFDHERLDVYRAAVDFGVWRWETARRLPRGSGDLADQLACAATSIALNIAEGSGERSEPEKRHFFRMARRSATECAAALDLMDRLQLVPPGSTAPGRTLLVRIVSMLTRMTDPPPRGA